MGGVASTTASAASPATHAPVRRGRPTERSAVAARPTAMTFSTSTLSRSRQPPDLAQAPPSRNSAARKA